MSIPTDASLHIRAIPDEDMPRFVEMEKEYVGMGEQELRAWRAARPEWFRAAYLDGDLIGICCGVEKDAAVILQSIAVLFEHWRSGIGSQLLRDFEETVFRDYGMTGISLGSADDHPTEAFYLKNGYRPRYVMLSVPLDAPEQPADAPQPQRVRKEERETVLYFPVEDYESALRDELVSLYHATQGLFIFDKANPATT